MNKHFIFIIILALTSGQLLARQKSDCRSLMSDFMVKSELFENLSLFKNKWPISEKKKFLRELIKLEISAQDAKTIIYSLNIQLNPVKADRAIDYLKYALSLNKKNRKLALLDLAQLDAREVHSKLVIKFMANEEKIQKRFALKNMTLKEKERYKELYYGCRSFSPNQVNKNAGKEFMRFNLSLNLGTLAASYAFYNMDKEKNTEWWSRLGYDLGATIFFSYIGGKIQSNPHDTQIVKSLKGYFTGRAMGFTDLFVYDPIFNTEYRDAGERIKTLKENPKYKDEVSILLEEYNKRGLYRKLKEGLINTLKKLPNTISLGLKGNSIDENNIDWNNLTHADLDRPEVQDVLVAAAMMKIYNENKGELIDTGDQGLDRYAYYSAFYAAMMPKSIIQNFITYRMLCMGQDNSKQSFTNAVLFNVASNFLVGQVFLDYRHKSINQ